MNTTTASINDRLEPLPGALPALWRVLRRGYGAEPWMLVVAIAVTLLAALPDALFALWLMLIVQGLTADNTTLLWIGALGLAASATLTWALKVSSERIQRRFRDRIGIVLEAHVAELQATISTVAHHERPECIDRLTVLRDQVFTLDHMYMSIFSMCGWILRLAVTGMLLAIIHPALVVLMLFAVPTVSTATWRPVVERHVEERMAPKLRLAMHLFDVATTAATAKEVRVTGIEKSVSKDRRAVWNEWYANVAQARTMSAAYNALGWLIFALGFVLAIAFVVYGLEASPAQTLLVLAAGSRLSNYVSATVGELGALRGIWMDGSKRLAWLEDHAAKVRDLGNEQAPPAIQRGIRFENVSFCYPGTSELVLDNINLTLRAGSVVALVGENGAGKSTLVKLLARMYEPSAGSIYVDAQPLREISSKSWRGCLAGAFQDFFQFELPTKHTIGLGDLPNLENRTALLTAVDRAAAGDVLEQLPDGLQTQLGATWPDGVQLSFGQWQKLSLARGFMRDVPLLLVLDEPTAALDAETEYALFSQYARRSREAIRRDRGSITILVSHRFSTVRMADQIVVLDGAQVVESGSHEQLMADRKQYAELFAMQAEAYR